MKLLLDECLPWRLKPLLAASGHECQTAREAGLSGKENGELLDLAENVFDVLVTIDKNIRHQQNLAGRKIAAPDYPLCLQRSRRHSTACARGSGRTPIAPARTSG